MITESKVIELFCMADDFCFFDAMMTKYTLKSTVKHTVFSEIYNRQNEMRAV